MTEDAPKSPGSESRKRTRRRPPRDSATRQASAMDPWIEFTGKLLLALQSLEQDQWLVLAVKETHRYVQFYADGSDGVRAESVSGYYLPEGDHLDEDACKTLLELGWHVPTGIPDQPGHDPGGSPNYFLKLPQSVPLKDVAVLGVLTLTKVHGAENPGQLEYSASSNSRQSICLPQLGIRQAGKEASASSFRWNRFSKRIARDFARAVALPVAHAADELAAKYGEPPTGALVDDLWPLLRDRWLAARPGIRKRVVSELREAGLGDGAIDIGSRTGLVDYLHSCHPSTRLTEIILAAFIGEFEWRPRRAVQALESIADNVAYIRAELPGLWMPERIRTAILVTCAQFDPIVRRVSEDDSAFATSLLSGQSPKLLQSGGLYEMGSNAGGLMSAFEALHAVVLRLRKAARRNSKLAIVEMLLEESASNMLSAFEAFGESMASGGKK